MELYAEIIINSDALEIDRPFTYYISKDIKDKIKVGQIVKVPFGKGNKQTTGFVLRIIKESDLKSGYRIKKITNIVTNEPVVTKQDIELINFLR